MGPLTLLCNAVIPGSCVLLKAFAFRGEKEQARVLCGVNERKNSFSLVFFLTEEREEFRAQNQGVELELVCKGVS